MDFSAVKALLDNTGEFITGPGRDCIVFVGGKQVFRHFTGLKDMENGFAMQGNELYNLYSCTKVSTCAAALTLVDKGILSLEDPVSKYIPSFANLKLASGEAVRKEMKIRNLFTMTGGLNYNIYNPSFEAVKQSTDGRFPTVETVSALANEPLGFEPGSRYQYSLCHDVLAAVVEVCSGMRYSEYIKKEIFEPLGIRDTAFFISRETERDRMATQYQLKDGNVIPMGNSNWYTLGGEYESGGAGLISSTEDYVKLLDALCHNGLSTNGRQILKPETVKLMRTPCLSGELLESYHRSVGWSAGYNYGLGVYVLENGSEANSVAPAGTFGWDGAAGSFISIDPINKITIFFTQHILFSDAHSYHEALRNEIYKAIKE